MIKQIFTSFKTLAVMALVILVAACASTTSQTQGNQNMLITAGFKVITPSKPDQVAILKSLPADEISPLVYKGKSYYVMPDAGNNQAYVGGPDQYAAYKKLRQQKQIGNRHLQASQVNDATARNIASWGGPGFGVPVR